MKFEVWEVVSCPLFPNQENNNEGTSRPAIIIEDLQDEVIIIPISKQIHQAARYEKTIFIKKDGPEAKAMGLTFDSIIVIDRKEQLSKIRLIKRSSFKCPEGIISAIEELL